MADLPTDVPGRSACCGAVLRLMAFQWACPRCGRVDDPDEEVPEDE